VEAVDDVYLSLVTERGELPFARSTARAVARKALGDPQATVLPVGADPSSEAGLRVELVHRVLSAVEGRKRALRALSFDDLLARVRDTLTDEVTGPAACARLRARFSVVLVDEFQDTDPVQWDVLHSAFHGHRTLVVIGDPKQAVYGFRGADVAAYLTAKRHAGVTQTLGTNWRSDPLLLDGIGALLRGAALGHPEIVVTDVAAGRTTAALGPGADPQPVRLRVVRRSVFPGTRDPGVDRAREVAARDCAAQVVAVLARGTPADTAGLGAVAGRSRPRTSPSWSAPASTPDASARRCSRSACPASSPSRRACSARPPRPTGCCCSRRSSSPTARVACAASPSARSAGCAPPTWPADGSERRIDALSQDLREWADVLAQRGVAALFAVLSESTGLAPRLLGVTGGERVLTDLRHVSEWSTATPSRPSWACPAWWGGCAGRWRRPTTARRSARAGSTPSGPRCRSSRCTPARASSTPS
jgi:exodeoxyribonuclease V beta subunit